MMSEFETLAFTLLFLAFIVFLSAVAIVLFRRKKPDQIPISRKEEPKIPENRDEKVLGPHV